MGMAAVRDASGHVHMECRELTQAQIDRLRIGRSITRAMQKLYPQAVVQPTDPGTGMTFRIVYTDPAGSGFNDSTQPERKAALEAALGAWTSVLKGTVEVVVEAKMQKEEGDDESTLASAGSIDYVVIDGVRYTTALAAQKKGVRAAKDGEADIDVSVNPEQDWDYSADYQKVEGGKSGLVYTLIHEVGHGLGFSASFDSETGELRNPEPNAYDLFVNRGSAGDDKIRNHQAAAIIKDLISDDLFFNGPFANKASINSEVHPGPMIKLYAPSPYKQGSSVSHVDQNSYEDVRAGLMTPEDYDGAGGTEIDPLTLGIMQDIGYELMPQEDGPPDNDGYSRAHKAPVHVQKFRVIRLQ
jgi:hypothetical protein